MTVYIDNARIPARVGRTTGRWSHLTADTKPELHEFAAKLWAHIPWFQDWLQTCKRQCGPAGMECIHWHYDVVDIMRDRAIRLGAVPIDFREMGEILAARRAAQRAGEDS